MSFPVSTSIPTVEYTYLEPDLLLHAPCVSAETTSSTLTVYLYIYRIDFSLVEGPDEIPMTHQSNAKSMLPFYNKQYPYLNIYTHADGTQLAFPFFSFDCVVESDAGNVRFENQCITEFLHLHPEWKTWYEDRIHVDGSESIVRGSVEVTVNQEKVWCVIIDATTAPPLTMSSMSSSSPSSSSPSPSSPSLLDSFTSSFSVPPNSNPKETSPSLTSMATVFSNPSPMKTKTMKWACIDELIYSPKQWTPALVVVEMFKQHPIMRHLMIRNAMQEWQVGPFPLVVHSVDAPVTAENASLTETAEKTENTENASLTETAENVKATVETAILPQLDEKWGLVYKYTSTPTKGSRPHFAFLSNVYYNIDPNVPIDKQKEMWERSSYMYINNSTPGFSILASASASASDALVYWISRDALPHKGRAV